MVKKEDNKKFIVLAVIVGALFMFSNKTEELQCPLPIELFETVAEAEQRASEVGCEGHHAHADVYMACESHGIAMSRIGKGC